MRNELPGQLGRHIRHAFVSRRLNTNSTSTIAPPARHLTTIRCLCNQASAIALSLDDFSERCLPPHLKHQAVLSHLVQRRSKEIPAEWRELLEEHDAAKMIDILRNATQAAIQTPLSVLRLLLAREYLPPAVLGQCLDHIKALHAETHIRGIRLRQLLRRLTYHARQVSPEALEAVTGIFLQHMPVSLNTELRNGPSGLPVLRRRSSLCNAVLSMLATAPSVRPYDSSTIQETALFRVLQHMVDHEPNLIVDAEGYRAVARLQLRLPKTDQEKQWASLKALSWPPWKQDRHAMDSKLGPEYGISKAKATLQKKLQAGYNTDDWDRAASIYAGWDSDGTPTIQTRRDIMPHIHSRVLRPNIWAARISATRTTQEAWAVWLEYQSQSDKIHDSAAFALLKRLSQEESRVQGLESHSLPGDGSEIHAPPSSTHLHTYTRTSPPSTHEFFHMLLARHKRERRKMHPDLARYFITRASTWQNACEYVDHLENMYVGRSTGILLGGLRNHREDKHLPVQILAAAAIALCQFVQIPNIESVAATQSGLHNTFTQWITTSQGIGYRLQSRHNFVRAVGMIQQLPRRKQSSPWRAVLRVLSDAKNSVRMLHLSRPIVKMVGDGGWLLPGLTGSEQVRLRYNMLTLQNYQLSLQVQDLILKQVYFDLHMLYELAAITARCGQTYHEMLQNCLHPHRGSTWREKYKMSGMLETMTRVVSDRPAKILIRCFRIYAGLEKPFKTPARTTVEVQAELRSSSNAMTSTPISWSDVVVEVTEDTEPVPECDEAFDLEVRSNVAIEPGHLHQWIRAIGMYGDHAAMLQLLRQICEDETIAIVQDMSSSAARILRQSIVAVRVFLERNWIDKVPARTPQDSHISPEHALSLKLYRRLCQPASEAQLREASELLVKKFGEGMGRWASVEEVDEYSDGQLDYRKKTRVQLRDGS